MYFILLSPYDNEQSDLIHRIAKEPRLEQMVVESQLIKNFTKVELMRWPLTEKAYGPILRATPVFNISDPKGEKRWDDFRKRVIEHVSEPWDLSVF